MDDAAHRRHAELGFDEASWEERYRIAPALWSGRANPQLVAEAADLPPGRALDAGSGEGGDALWLAGRGCGNCGSGAGARWPSCRRRPASR